jgi:hypothetical protein
MDVFLPLFLVFLDLLPPACILASFCSLVSYPGGTSRQKEGLRSGFSKMAVLLSRFW